MAAGIPDEPVEKPHDEIREPGAPASLSKPGRAEAAAAFAREFLDVGGPPATPRVFGVIPDGFQREYGFWHPGFMPPLL